MRKRAIGYKDYDIEDPLDQYLDPLTRAAKQVMDDFIRWEIRFILQQEINNPQKPGTLMNDYLLEGSFYVWFNNVLLKKLIRDVAKDAMATMIFGEIIEDIVDEQTGFMTTVAVEEGIEDQAEYENHQAFKFDSERIVFDKLFMESLMDTFITDYVI